MTVHIRELSAPPDIKANEAKEAARIDRLIQQRNKQLSDVKISKIEKHLKKIIKSAKREYEPLRSRLTKYDDLMEGVVEETNFPFEGASNVTLRFGTGLARTFQAAFNKTVYSDEDLFAPVFDPGAEQDLNLTAQDVITLQEGFNHSFHTACNGIKELKSGTIPAFRDGTFLLEGSWERKTERVNDQRTYRTPEDFLKDYPTAADAGLSQDEYTAITDNFLVDEDCELIVRFSYNHVQQDGIEYRQVLRAKFLIYPTTVKKIKQATMYGCFFELTKDEIKRRANTHEFYEKGVQRCLARRGGSSLDSWDNNRLLIERRAAPLTEAMPYKLADIVFKFDLDEDDVLEQYSAKVVLEGEEVILVALRPYEVRYNIPSIIPFRLIERDHAFDGISLIGDGEDIFNQVDTLFRHDNNVMMMTTSPMFMADQALKDQLDLGRAENVLRPGVTFWVPNPDKMPIRQIPMQDIAAASGDNNAKIAILSRFVEMTIGVSQGESGNQTPDDPRAPAHKTQLLLMQANKRIDQCIDQWSLSFPELAQLHATLLYQFSPTSQYSFAPKVQPQPMGQGAQVPQQIQPKTFDLKLLADPRLKWAPRRRSVALTPEFAMNRLQMLLQVYMGLRPLLLQGDPIAMEAWNRMVKNSGEPQAEKFMMDPQTAPSLAQKSIEMAMKQHQMQSTMKAHAKGQETLAKESAKHVVGILSDQARANASGLSAEEDAAKPTLNGANT